MAEQMKDLITVIYDGASPRMAAENLFNYVQTLGYPACLAASEALSQSRFKVSGGKMIVVGHHDFARTLLNEVGTQYENNGMSFGFDSCCCVLRASRSALGAGTKGREKFSACYNSRIGFHKQLAEQYGVPLRFGQREETRVSQYDLLWLEFVKYGLQAFLDTAPQERAAGVTLTDPAVSSDSAVPDTSEQTANELIAKAEAVKDKGVEWITEKAFQKGLAARYRMTLRCHLGLGVVFTGEWTGLEKQLKVDSNELLPGELAAFTVPVGAYSLRVARRLYRPFEVYGQFQQEGIPIVRDELTEEDERYEYDQFAEYVKRQEGANAFVSIAGLEPCSSHFRLFQEVSAKLRSSTDGYQLVCRATHAGSYRWSERIGYVCAVKRNILVPEERAALFACVHFSGDSHSSDTWCKLLPDGTVTTYQGDIYGKGSYSPSLEL